jgi:DNA repair protein RadC
MQQHFFSFESSKLQKNKPDPSSHCSSVQERLVTYGSEALDTTEHLGLILGSQRAADTLLKHFGSLAVLARASVEELLPFVPRSKALRLVSSLRMGAVALREERQSLTIDSPEAIADLCSEMRFLDREWLRVVLLNAKQQLIKVATVSQGSVNESLAHPREVFKPAIVLSAYSFILCIIIPPATPLLRKRICASPGGFLKRAESCKSIYSITWSSGCRLPPQQLFQFQRRSRHFMTTKALFSELLYDSHSARWNELELPELSLGELQALCKLLGCSSYGTKETLVVRLLATSSLDWL